MENNPELLPSDPNGIVNKLLADLKNYNFVTSFPQGLNLSFDVPVQNSDLANLKAKIRSKTIHPEKQFSIYGTV
jgi:hypothetical protein